MKLSCGRSITIAAKPLPQIARQLQRTLGCSHATSQSYGGWRLDVAVAAHAGTGFRERRLRLRGHGRPSVDHRRVGHRARPAVAVTAFFARHSRWAERTAAAYHVHDGGDGQREEPKSAEGEECVAREPTGLRFSQKDLDAYCNLTPEVELRADQTRASEASNLRPLGSSNER